MFTQAKFFVILTALLAWAVIDCNSPNFNNVSNPQGDCPSGKILCGGSCKEAAADSNNCGTCGNVCAAGYSCENSTCVRPTSASTCSSGQTSCSGTCKDLMSDAANCGACGTVCNAGQSCVAGTCTAPVVISTCSNGQTSCSGTCKNLMSDGANCGACGTVCNDGKQCSAGVCRKACSALVACTAAEGICTNGFCV